MKKKSDDLRPKGTGRKTGKPSPDDSINSFGAEPDEAPEIFGIHIRGRNVDRAGFLKSAASLTGLAALGSVLKSCEESEYDIVKKNDNCSCHVVCTCNSEIKNGEKYEKGSTFISTYDINKKCICDTICTCNTICTCDSVCGCNSDGGGGGGSYSYTYWYPN